MSKLLIYGATGATGHRLAELAVEAGLVPVVAGRGADEISRIADALGVEGRVASLPEIGGVLGDVSVVASCVGPYTHIGRPVLAAALAAGASCLDLTGECRFVERVIAECAARRWAGGCCSHSPTSSRCTGYGLPPPSRDTSSPAPPRSRLRP